MRLIGSKKHQKCCRRRHHHHPHHPHHPSRQGSFLYQLSHDAGANTATGGRRPSLSWLILMMILSVIIAFNNNPKIVVVATNSKNYHYYNHHHNCFIHKTLPMGKTSTRSGIAFVSSSTTTTTRATRKSSFQKHKRDESYTANEMNFRHESSAHNNRKYFSSTRTFLHHASTNAATPPYNATSCCHITAATGPGTTSKQRISKNEDNEKRTDSSSALSASTLSHMVFDDNHIRKHKVFCDLDSVLVDFETGVRNLLGSPPSKIVKGTMWKTIARANAFYDRLPWTRDGKELWTAIRHLQPDILTGVPYPKSSRVDKFNWCKRELNVPKIHHVDMAAGCNDHEPVNGNQPLSDAVNVITCWSNNKFFECSYRSVLIDDRESLREAWENAGGIFIHHIDTKTTIQKLKEYGIL